jgi:hypothetical protein
MKFVSMMSAVALASVLAACGTAPKDDAQIAPGAVGGRSDCGAKDPLSID